MRVELKDGFTCKCGFHEPFNGYVAAHWDIALQRECPDCKRVWKLKRGVMKIVRPTYIAIKDPAL